MKSPLRSKPNTSASLALAGAMSLAAHASPAIHYIDLHPPKAVESYATAISGGKQVGVVFHPVASTHWRAATWSGSPESYIDLHPVTGAAWSQALATDHGVHGGWKTGDDPILWIPRAPGTWEVINLRPAGWRSSYVNGMGGGRQVGHALFRNGLGFPGLTLHATLWSGTAESGVDLNPAGWQLSQALGTNGPRQVGIVSNKGLNNGHAALWQGDAASFVDLNPPGFNYSAARCTTGDLQGGYATADGTYKVAGIWHGTADSFVSLNPDGAASSEVLGADETWQAGYASIDGHSRACAWQASADSFLDLHGVLRNDGFTSSSATGVEVNGREIKVCGTGFIGGIRHALLWTIKLPDTEPPVIESATSTPDTLWPPNGKLVPVAVEAQVTDNDGVATWHIADVTCNERFKNGDIVISDDHTVQLRATRSGSNREGRIYTVILIAEDPAGNPSEPFELDVVVPHNRKPQRPKMEPSRRAPDRCISK